MTSAVKRSRRLRWLGALACALGVLGFARSAAPAELSAFVSGASPGDNWGRGYGVMMTISFFDLVHGEIEGASQGSDLADTRFLSASGKAYLGPTFGRLVPYVGLGAGVYHESVANGSDNGTLGSVFIGAKLKFPMGLVLRAEYQWIKLPQGVVLPLDNRYFFAAGLRF